jgi:hypothetical protein
MPVVYPSDEELHDLVPEQPFNVDSDAPTNAQAILEVELWCRKRGLVRTAEASLRALRAPDGKVVRRAICYLPSEATRAARDQVWEDLRQHVANMPETPSSVDLSRED